MYTINEFAEKVGRTPYTIRFWLQSGYLKRKKFSGSLYFIDEDVEKSEQIKQMLKKRKIALMNWARKQK